MIQNFIKAKQKFLHKFVIEAWTRNWNTWQKIIKLLRRCDVTWDIKKGFCLTRYNIEVFIEKAERKKMFKVGTKVNTIIYTVVYFSEALIHFIFRCALRMMWINLHFRTRETSGRNGNVCRTFVIRGDWW